MLRSGITKSSARRGPLDEAISHTAVHARSAATVPDLLQQAEETLLMEEGPDLTFSPHRSSSPGAANSTFMDYSRLDLNANGFSFMRQRMSTPVGPREWSKEDWKLLDSCFTDERLTLAGYDGQNAAGLAPAENVDVENVVERFVDMSGGWDRVRTLGDAWSQ